MAPRLIINADDFGLTPGVNRAIAELHQAKALTSATLMATGPAFEDAVAIARANPALGVGCPHPPYRRRSRLESTKHPHTPRPRRQKPSPFAPRLHPGSPARKNPRRRNRTRSTRPNSETPTCGDQRHPSRHPQTHAPLSRRRSPASAHCRALVHPRIRYPFEQSWSLALDHGNRIRRLQVKLLSRLKSYFEQQPQIRNAHVSPRRNHRHLRHRQPLRQDPPRILHAIPAEGTFELCCHPGYNDSDLDRIATRLAPIATSSAAPCSPKSPHSPCIQTPRNSSTMGTSVHIKVCKRQHSPRPVNSTKSLRTYLKLSLRTSAVLSRHPDPERSRMGNDPCILSFVFACS